MRKIAAKTIVKTVAAMCIETNRKLPADVLRAFEWSMATETTSQAREIFRQLLENAAFAKTEGLPICQDTGLGVFFVELGEETHVVGGQLKKAIHAGMRQGYDVGLLRKSVCHPLTRKNTGDNTPAIIHIDIVPGDRLKIYFMAKGGGSENMSRVTFLMPTQGWAGIKKFILNLVVKAGSNPCPPIILGIGIGGNCELAALNAKRALFRSLDDMHPDPEVAALEIELLEALNSLGIGPMGLGGNTTCLGVKITMVPCHLASLPVAVNVQCHAQRHAEVTL
ncbi:putative L(+)-tartrate dehydratase subunit alpha [Desulfovibrionales bacterium]